MAEAGVPGGVEGVAGGVVGSSEPRLPGIEGARAVWLHSSSFLPPTLEVHISPQRPRELQDGRGPL